MKTLSQLMTMHSSIMQQISEADGELTPEVELVLKEFETKFPEKVDSYATLDDRLTAEIAYFKQMADEMTAKRRTLENIKTNLKERVKSAFDTLGIKEVEGQYFKYKMIRGRPSLVVNPIALNEKYKKQVITVEIDKKMIEEDLKTGVDVQGASWAENEYLKKFIKTKIKD